MAQKDATTLAYWLKRTRGMKNAKNKAYTLQKRAVASAGRTGRADLSKVVKSDWGRQAYLGEAPKARTTPVSPTSGTPGPPRPPKQSKGSKVAGQVGAAVVGGAILGGGAYGVGRKMARDKASLAKAAARTNKQQATRERNVREAQRAERAAEKARTRNQQARAGAARAAGAALGQTGRGQTAPRPVKIVDYTKLGDAPSPEARKGSGGRLGRAARASSGRR